MAVMEMRLVTSDPTPEPEGSSREEVAARWVAGDGEALRLAFDAWGGAVHAYCARRLSTDDAADATQEVFVSAWRARAQFEPARGSLGQWLFGIARNTCVTFHRRGARVPDPVADLPGRAGTPPRDDVIADRLLLAGALSQLPDRQRRVVLASFVDGWTNQEVAERLAVPLGTVKSDIRRGLQALRLHLEAAR